LAIRIPRRSLDRKSCANCNIAAIHTGFCTHSMVRTEHSTRGTYLPGVSTRNRAQIGGKYGATYTKCKDLKDKMSPESRAETSRITAALVAEMPLEQLRAARQLTQTNLAQVLGVNQSAVSRARKANRYVLEHPAELHRSDGRNAGHSGHLS
jgi:predicted XRE-type DNA-binding protein